MELQWKALLTQVVGFLIVLWLLRKYAWGKVWNAEAYSACTNMPRFGHQGILTEDQVRDVVALLMDPASPVNQ